MSELRVMTYNIFMAGRRGSVLHDVVRRSRPDVLLVNEAPKRPLLSGRDCRRLAARWGMRYVGGGRRAGSNMITVAGPVDVKWMRCRVLPQPLFQPRRGIVSAQLKVRGSLVGVVACHLSLDEQRRLSEVAEVIGEAQRLRGPVIIAGDINERPDGPAWRLLRDAGWVDHGDREWRTFPAEEPDARIDALLVRGAAHVDHHGDPGVPADLLATASDHRPVLARLRW